MSALASLAACAGRWVGTSRLQDPHSGTPDESPSTMTVSPVLDGRFVRIDYDWAYRGKPQQGSMLIGCESDSGTVTAHWIDTWHMGDKAMACRGAAQASGGLVVRGSYAAPPGPDWSWRTAIAPGEGRLRLVMHNVSPEGREDLAVEAEYSRASN